MAGMLTEQVRRANLPGASVSLSVSDESQGPGRMEAHVGAGTLPRRWSQPGLFKHNRAAFLTYLGCTETRGGGSQMRFIFGLIIGGLLTVGGAYVADSMSSSTEGSRPMVNWDVVAKNLDSVTALAREGWKKIVG
jgi:hypothetical protein